MKMALSFDDVLLVPQHNEIVSRKDVNTSTRLSKTLTLKIPIISSCMDTVTGSEMASAMWRAGGLGILHRYNTIEQQLQMFLSVRDSVVKESHEMANCAIAVGATGDYFDRAQTLYRNGAKIFCIDVANGDSKISIEAIHRLRKEFPDTTLIAGNVATGEGCARLIDAGADAIRAGIGGGSLCTTRIMTGHGVPTFQTVLDCHEYLWYRKYNDFCIISDGGIKNSGDIVKSIAAGASAVMLGQLLASTDEAPGDTIYLPEGDPLAQPYKRYRGMASFGAQADWRPEKKEDIVPEGEDTILPCKGSVDKMLYQLVGRLRSGMTYSNAKTLKELKNNAQFRPITSAGWAESKPHAKVGY